MDHPSMVPAAGTPTRRGEAALMPRAAFRLPVVGAVLRDHANNRCSLQK